MIKIRFWYVMLKLFEDLPSAVSSASTHAVFSGTRAHSLELTAALSVEDCAAQSMPDASPAKWHLAHTTWFFETFILERFEADFKPFDPAFRVLFNSYYNGVGEKYSRAQRGLLTRPSLSEVLAYRQNVDVRMLRLLSLQPEQQEISMLVELGLQHEQQHQELIVTDAQHLLSLNPLYPAFGLALVPAAAPAGIEWLDFAAGVVEIGHDGEGFCFDNETPKHRQFVERFSLASRLVTNREFAEFIADGGYRKPEYWLSDGWNWVQSNRVEQPLYWREADGWHLFTLSGLVPLPPDEAVLHVSYFEASAYAAWAKARLPTEAEWEVAAGSGAQPGQMFGTAWQWTSSAYAAYPGFVTAAGAVGEYNGKFMVNQYVLRGSSLATPAGHSRASYRNFFPADARWQFSGIRLAK